jgi:hypothetical protein
MREQYHRCYLQIPVRPDRAFLLALLAACHPPAKPQPAAPAHKVRLAVFPAESAEFPKTAKAMTTALSDAKVAGIEDTLVAKTSLGDAQLLIECNDPTPECYAAVGKSLEADRMLFAVIEKEPKKKVKITITLFDVIGHRNGGHAEKVFASEAEATAGLDGLIAEATK